MVSRVSQKNILMRYDCPLRHIVFIKIFEPIFIKEKLIWHKLGSVQFCGSTTFHLGQTLYGHILKPLPLGLVKLSHFQHKTKNNVLSSGFLGQMINSYDVLNELYVWVIVVWPPLIICQI